MLLSKDFIKDHLKDCDPIQLRVHLFITNTIGEIVDIVLRYLKTKKTLPENFKTGVLEAVNVESLQLVIFEEPESVIKGVINHIRTSNPSSYLIKDGKMFDPKQKSLIRKTLQDQDIRLQSDTFILFRK